MNTEILIHAQLTDAGPNDYIPFYAAMERRGLEHVFKTVTGRVLHSTYRCTTATTTAEAVMLGELAAAEAHVQAFFLAFSGDDMITSGLTEI